MLSFVIPARNEENLLPLVLRSIAENVRDTVHEIIVIDHESLDGTAEVAREAGARVFTMAGETIGELRNRGVEATSGQILVFLDSDVLLTEDWGNRIASTIDAVRRNPLLITGSWCDLPSDATWIERVWFTPPKERRPTHLGTGHLIVSKLLFDMVEGFDESLETGEDYDFCRRAAAEGAEIVDDPSLRVIHEGYPKTIWQFFKREIWHGRGDASSSKTFIRSKVAKLAGVFLLLHLVVALSLFLLPGGWPLTLAAAAGIAVICWGSSTVKYGSRSFGTVVVTGFLYYLYFWARGLSLLPSLPDRITPRKGRR